MKFRYHKLLLKERSPFFGSTILKPIIAVKVIIKDKELNYEALMDSGADFCIFDAANMVLEFWDKRDFSINLLLNLT